ncbi:MAG TPA: FmdB family zinc ribbon protein [Dehalococcoidales bacterium]|nr:FmdB family zinc ribbon protein [Dehalococcoidales bacterium]
MPIYEYECGKCSHRFDVKQGFHDKPEAECPQCREIARRVFHPTPIIFKGSGFYVTDHRPSRKDAEPEKSKGEPEKSKGESEAGKSSK